MLAATKFLRDNGSAPPICLAVHALFCETAYADLGAVAADVVTCDTILHPSNRIPVASLIPLAIRAPRNRERDHSRPRAETPFSCERRASRLIAVPDRKQ